MRFFHFLAIMLFVIIGSQTATAGALTKQQFRDNIVGRTLKWTNKSLSGTVRYFKSGKIVVTFRKYPKLAKDYGRWTWRNGRVCTTYKVVRKGKEKCEKLFPSGKVFKTESGAIMR